MQKKDDAEAITEFQRAVEPGVKDKDVKKKLARLKWGAMTAVEARR